MADRATTLSGRFQKVTLDDTKVLGCGNYTFSGNSRRTVDASEFGVDVDIFEFGGVDGGTITITDAAYDPTDPQQNTLRDCVENGTKLEHKALKLWVNSTSILVAGTSGKTVMTKAGEIRADRNGLARTSFEGQVSGAFMYLTSVNTWYVRPSGGSYGTEDGTSYNNAWNGFSNITWGAGGVQPGDTLYVCGEHNEILTPGIDGAVKNHINIKGDYPGESGSIVASPVISSWTGPDGNGVYTHTDGASLSCYYIMEDGIALDEASDATCSDGNWYSSGATYYYKPTSDAPTNHTIRVCQHYSCINGSGGINYITISGMTFQYYREAVYCVNSNYITCTGNTFNFGVDAFLSMTNGTDHCQGIDVNNNSAQYTARSYALYSHNSTGSWHISCTISNNTVTNGNNTGNGGSWSDAVGYVDREGIGCQNLESCTITSNTLAGNIRGIFVYNGTSMVSKDNTISHNIVTVDGCGLLLSSAASGDAFNNNDIHHNVLVDCGTADTGSLNGAMYLYNKASATDVNRVVNNTIYDGGHGFYLDSNSLYYSIKNNIVYATNVNMFFNSSSIPTGTELDYNNYYPDKSTGFYFNGSYRASLALWKAATSQDDHSINSDPSLDSDYKLQAGSLCIDAGTTISGVTDGYHGTAPDIGAYESNF